MQRNSGALLTVAVLAGLALGTALGCAAAPSPASKSAEPTATPAGTPAANPPPPAANAGAFKPGDDADGKPATLDDAQRQFDQDFKAFQAAGSDCVTLCKALSSMKRAAEHLCALAAEGGEPDKKRCGDAREKVAGATTKVNQTCGGCGNL